MNDVAVLFGKQKVNDKIFNWFKNFVNVLKTIQEENRYALIKVQNEETNEVIIFLVEPCKRCGVRIEFLKSHHCKNKSSNKCKNLAMLTDNLSLN